MGDTLRQLAALLCVFTIGASLAACSPAPQPNSIRNSRLGEPAPPLPTELAPLTQQRIRDLLAIRHALELYKSGHSQRYPATDLGWRGWTAEFGQSMGEKWMPQLVPHYLSVAPRDPAKSDHPRAPQYLYISDGRAYKLIVANADDCSPAIEIAGVKMDPMRIYDGQCAAYGVWSGGGEGF